MSNDPYASLAPVPPIAVRAAFADGGSLPLAQVSPGQGGQGLSPALSWDAVPGAVTYLVSAYDPDAPTQSGFWHWVVYNVPGEVTELAEGAGSGELALLPAGAVAGYNEALSREYLGAAPPAGHGPHRYFFTVQALDALLDVPADLTAARLHFQAREHVIARGHLHAVWQNPQG